MAYSLTQSGFTHYQLKGQLNLDERATCLLLCPGFSQISFSDQAAHSHTYNSVLNNLFKQLALEKFCLLMNASPLLI